MLEAEGAFHFTTKKRPRWFPNPARLTRIDKDRIGGLVGWNSISNGSRLMYETPRPRICWTGRPLPGRLEPAALPVILEELRSRGLTPEAIVAHESARGTVLYDETGAARTCQLCRKPAVVKEWGWHRMFGRLPLFPRPFYLCEDHRTKVKNEGTSVAA